MADGDMESSRALAGRRIVVTRAGREGAAFATRLRECGALAEHVPAIAFCAPSDAASLDHALDTLRRYDWIVFTSANAVDAFAARLTHRPLGDAQAMPRMAAVGASTAGAIAANNWPVSFVPSQPTGRHLAAELPMVAGMRVLVPRSSIADDSLPTMLRARGAVLDEVIAYCTVPDPGLDKAVAALFRVGGVDALTFTSPSCVAAFVDAASRNGVDLEFLRRTGGMRVICIGRTTAAAARANHLEPDGVSDEPSVGGLIRALALCFQQAHPVQTV